MKKVKGWRRGLLVRKGVVADHCWAPGVDWASTTVSQAMLLVAWVGPRISRRDYELLVEVFGDSAEDQALMLTVYGGCHLMRARSKDRVLDVPWDFLALDAAVIVETSASVNAATMGAMDAARSFKETVKGALNVPHSVTPKEELLIRAEAGVPLNFCGGAPLVTDHVVLAVLRKVIRQVHERLNAVATTMVPTLVVGAAAREVRLYGSAEHVDYYIPACEGKDYSRNVIPMMNALAAKLRKMTNKDKRHSANKEGSFTYIMFRSLGEISAALASLESWGNRFFSTLAQIDKAYERLVFEDVYDLSPADYRELFIKTGANSAVGYGFYPDELVFPDCVPSKHYVYHADPLTLRSRVVYREGYSNGYEHDTAKWGAFLRNPVMDFPEFKLVFEITSRVGPYLTYTVTRASHKTVDPVVRRFELREARKYVRVLDVKASVGPGGLLLRKRTFAVLQDEWDTLVNWVLSLDEKSMTFANVMSQVRRVAGGVSLVNKELTKAWDVPRNRHPDLALAALIYALKVSRRSDYLSSVATSRGRTGWDVLSSAVHLPLLLVEGFIGRLMRSSIADHIVEYPAGYVESRVYLPTRSLADFAGPLYKMAVHPEGEQGSVYCATCAKLDGQLGAQKVRCINPHLVKETAISFSEEERNRVMVDLTADDLDAGGLARLKARVKSRVPAMDSHVTTRLHYVRGGPGSGKSFIARALVAGEDESTCVYVPTNDLTTDYREFTQAGVRRKINNVATVHRGLELPTCRTLIVDEISMHNWDYVKMVIINTCPDDVYLIGDEKQTHINEPDEGYYFANAISPDALPVHELTVNFRNPRGTVALLNARLGYDFESASPLHTFGIEVVRTSQVDRNAGAVKRMYFSHQAAKEFGNIDETTAKEKYTVRSQQGKTHDRVELIVSEFDGNVVKVPGMNVVALSRHKECLTVAHDGSAVALAWLAEHALDDESLADPARTLPDTPVHDAEAMVSESKKTAEAPAVVALYARAETVVPAASYRRDFLVLSKPQLVTALIVAHRLFPWYSRIVAEIGVLTLLAMALGISFREAWAPSVWTPVRTIARLFAWILRNVYLSLPVLLAAVRAPAPVARAVVAEGPAAEGSPLLAMLMRVYLPAWARAGAFSETVRLPFTVLTTAGSQLHSLEGLPGLGWLRSVATVANHFGELPGMPSKVLATMVGWPVHTLLVVAVLYRCRCAVPSFVVYARGDSADLRVGASAFLVALQAPNLKVAVQLQGFHYELPAGHWEAFQSFLGFSRNYLETAGRFFVKAAFRHHSFREEVDLERAERHGRIVTPRDAFRGALDGVGADAADVDLPAYNAYGSSLIPSSWGKGAKLDTQALVNPTNSRGNFSRQAVGWRFLRGIGHLFSSRSPAQAANVLGSRYLNPKRRPSRALDARGRLLAATMVKRFLAEHADMANYSIDYDLLARVENEADRMAQIKGYDKQLQGIDSPFFADVRFHLKDIWKPSPVKTPDLTKPGQGISAWSKDAQVTFGTGVRYANAAFQRVLRSHVVFDNRITASALFERLGAAIARTPEGSVNGVTDFTMFDAQQDDFTQEIERQFLFALGFSEDFVEQYYRLRKGYRITGAVISGRAGTEKTSGEPGTLLFNSVVNAVMMNYVLRGQGPVALALKGDDGFKRQASLKCDESAAAEVAIYTNMSMRMSFEDPAEFCGCVIGKSGMLKNLGRRLNSVTGRTFKDYAAFALYQVSLRDWLADLAAPELRADTLAANAAILAARGTSAAAALPAATAVLEQLESFSHLGREQFESSAGQYGEVTVFFAADGAPVLAGGLLASAAGPSAREIAERVRLAAAKMAAQRTESVEELQRRLAAAMAQTTGFVPQASLAAPCGDAHAVARGEADVSRVLRTAHGRLEVTRAVDANVGIPLLCDDILPFVDLGARDNVRMGRKCASSYPNGRPLV